MKIFISYAREDLEPAKRLFDALATIGEVNPWLDRENLLPGMDWEETILSAIEESRFIILLLSSHSIDKTTFVQEEFKAALHRFTQLPPGALFLIPVRLDACEPTKYPELSRLHAVDMFPEWQSGLSKIVRAIKDGMDRDLASTFDTYDEGKHLLAFSKDDWISEHQDYLVQFRAVTIIDFLDKRYTRFADELDALNLMIQLSERARSDSLASFVIRTHEVAKNLKFFYELPPAYGIVFAGGKLLPDYVRTMFFKTIYDNNVKFLKTRLLAYPDTSWSDELLLRDTAKHYMMQTRARDFSDREVAHEALKLMTWDIPYVDLAIFYSLREKRFANLPPLVGILKVGNARTRDRIGWSLPDYQPDPDGEPSDLPAFDEEKRRYADARETGTRIGALLRIGEYLKLSDSERHRAYGERLQEIALEAVTNPDSAAVLRGLSSDQRIAFCYHLERQDWQALRTLIPDTQALKGVASLFCRFSEVWDPECREFVPVSTDGDLVPSDTSD